MGNKKLFLIGLMLFIGLNIQASSLDSCTHAGRQALARQLAASSIDSGLCQSNGIYKPSRDYLEDMARGFKVTKSDRSPRGGQIFADFQFPRDVHYNVLPGFYVNTDFAVGDDSSQLVEVFDDLPRVFDGLPRENIDDNQHKTFDDRVTEKYQELEQAGRLSDFDAECVKIQKDYFQQLQSASSSPVSVRICLGRMPSKSSQGSLSRSAINSSASAGSLMLSSGALSTSFQGNSLAANLVASPATALAIYSGLAALVGERELDTPVVIKNFNFPDGIARYTSPVDGVLNRIVSSVSSCSSHAEKCGPTFDNSGSDDDDVFEDTGSKLW